MRHLSFALTALAAFLAFGCSNDGTIESLEQSPISFENTFVDKATRTAAEPTGNTTTDNITSINVYGYQGDKLLFGGTTVSKSSSGTWSYSPLKYWVTDATYNFIAVSGLSSVESSLSDGTLSVKSSFTNDGNTDPVASAQVSVTGAQSNAAVQFTMNHLLSKVKFTFTNGFANTDDVTLQVKSVKITNAYTSGSVTVSGDTPTIVWANQSGSGELSFGNTGEIAVPSSSTADANSDEAASALLIIPTTNEYEFTVTFSVDVIANASSLQGDGEKFTTATYNHTVTVKFTPESGKSYNLTATLNAKNVTNEEIKPITFTVNSVSDWEDYTDKSILSAN